MSGSLFRVSVAFALALALVLSTVPAQAQPHDPGSRLSSLDTSWFEAALGWLQGLLGGGSDSDLLRGAGRAVPMTGSCIDPSGKPVECPPENPGP